MSGQIRLLLNQSPSHIRLRSSDEENAARPPVAPPPQPAPADETADTDKIAEQLSYLQQLLNEVGFSIEELQQQHRDTLTELQQASIELAVSAASWIVGAAIDANQFAIDDLVQAMVDRLNTDEPIRVMMNPDDAELLNMLRNSADAKEFAAANVEYVKDTQLKRGEVRAESARLTLMTDMDERLADIRQIWLENLNDTQTERRADDPAGRGLRRFPERRHTA